MPDMRGFSTIEIVIAIAVMASTLAAVVLVSFGNQTLLGQTNASEGALEIAQSLLEMAQNSAREDFRLLRDVATSSAGSYQSSLFVGDVISDPYTTKFVTAIVSWSDASHITRNVTLDEDVTDFDDPATLDTCDSSLAGNWNFPSVSNYILAPGNMLPANSKMAAANTIGGIDAYHGKLYVVDSSRSAKSNDSLFIFDIANPIQPQYIGSANTATSTTDGMNAITVAEDYAFVANAHGANFKTCKPAGSCSQLQIFNVADALAPVLVADFLLPTSTAPYVIGSGGQAVGNALFYADGYLYLGLSKTSSGPEFNIIDVHDPSHPIWSGGFSVGATINQIYVHGGYAYLATYDQSHKLIILDVHDPRNPILTTSLDPHGTSNQEYGYSLYKVGDELYFGMSSTSISGSPELTSFDVTTPAAPVAIESREVGASVLDIFARDTDLFLLTSITGLKAQFQILDGAHLTDADPVSAPIALPGTGVSMDCERNNFYIGTNNASQGNISIIGPGL